MSAKARGNYRAALQQRDASNVVINAVTTITCNSGANGTAFINMYDVLRRSQFFSNYAPMYDQFKINRVRVKLNAITVPYNNCPTVFTAWSTANQEQE